MGRLEGRSVRFDSRTGRLAGGFSLEGLLQLPDSTPCPGVVVAHPHPQYGGDMHNNVVHALCRAALGAGAAALRFNFRGTGTSEGAFDGGRGEQDDVRAALAFLREQPEISGQAALAGYSFGAAVALRAAASLDICCLVAVSTPTIGGWLGDTRVACPVLFVSGDCDDYCDPQALQHIASSLADARLEMMRGVDHFWVGSADRLIETVQSFLESNL